MTSARAARWLAWPALLYLTVFFLIPTGMVVCYSLLERDIYGGVLSGFSLEAWIEAISPITLKTLGRSLLLASGVTVLCLVVGYPCAMTLARMQPRRRQVCVMLVSFPLITSLLLRIYGWINLLPVEWRGELWMIGLVMAVNYLPFMLLPLLRAWERMDTNLALAAMDLGATPLQTFWNVTFPLTRPGMWAGCALVFIPAAGEYLVPDALGQGKVRVLGTLIVEQFGKGRNWPYGAAAAVWLLGLVTLPMLVSLLSRSESGTSADLVERNSFRSAGR